MSDEGIIVNHLFLQNVKTLRNKVYNTLMVLIDVRFAKNNFKFAISSPCEKNFKYLNKLGIFKFLNHHR